MTSIPHPSTRPFTSPIIDCEPPPLSSAVCPPSTAVARARRTPRHVHPGAVVAGPSAGRESPAPPAMRELPAPPAAARFADAALRRVLEVVDRRRPVTQLRGLLTPPLIDTTSTLARSPQTGGAAVLRRLRLRSITGIEPGHPVSAAEVFATYTRGPRVRAIAARVELVAGCWQVVALQIG